MGILVISWNFPPRRGGIENLIGNLCHRLKKTHSLFVITSFATSTAGKEDWIFRSKWSGLVPFALYALYQGSLILWKNPGIKVILGGSTLVAPIVLLLAKSFRCKTVVLVHGLDLIHPKVLYQGLCVRWVRNCDRVIANSHYAASLAREKKAKGESIHVIPPGVDWESYVFFGVEQLKKEMGLDGRKVLLYVGRLARRKGLKEFLRNSFPKIVAEVPDLCFLIVGENPTGSLIHQDDVVGELKALVRDMGLEDHVRLLGSVSDGDLAKIYQVSDLMVLPALSMKDDVEGFGIVLLEAAAAGKPAVATRVGGIPDAIEDGKSGILIEPGDYGRMSETIIGLLRDDQTRSSMGRYAQKRARDQFGWEPIAGRYGALFESSDPGKGVS